MAMQMLFAGEVRVAYRQAYVRSEFDCPQPDEAFAGQTNGLCGAATPGALFLVTGLHTGRVGFMAELHDEPPSLDERWEDVVEVSFVPESADVALVCWGGECCWPLELEQTEYRVRYSATGMDEARSVDTLLRGERIIDGYLLQFWCAPVSGDQVVKETSSHAAYWHKYARDLPLPPPPPTLEELAEAERRAGLEREQRRRRFEDEVYWGGRPPSDRLRQVGASGLVELDRDLVDAIAEAAPDVQRSIARWAARRAYEEAGLADLDWAEAGLEALDNGAPLPAPFADPAGAFEVMTNDRRVVWTVVASNDGRLRNVSQQHMALPALAGAADDDPLRAALNALFAAAVTCGTNYPALLEQVRRVFPLPSH